MWRSVQPLMPEVHGLLQLLGIERPPLAAAHTVSIRQGRYATITEACQPLVSTAEADPCFRSKGDERHALIEVPTNQAFPTDRRQTGQWVATSHPIVS
jgi:hypothetical protein